MKNAINILGIPGSLRRGSFNHSALLAAKAEVPDGATLEIFELEGLPLFNQDFETQPTQKIIEFKNKIRAADAILFATPEYNFSLPGVLKNAIDCASRPYGDSAWTGKPAAIMGASPGLLGSARAQYDLRKILGALNMFAINQPEVMIGNASRAFGPDGNLLDESSRKLIRQLLENLVHWSQRLKL